MRIVRTLKISADEFFDYLEEQVVAQIARANADDAKSVDASAIKTGFTYTSHADDPYRRTIMEILEYDRGARYATRTVTLGDTVTMSYDVMPCDKGIKVTYIQDMESFNKKKRGLFRGFSEAVYLGRMGEALFSMEDRILRRKEGMPTQEQVASERPDQKLLKKLVERSAR